MAVPGVFEILILATLGLGCIVLPIGIGVAIFIGMQKKSKDD